MYLTMLKQTYEIPNDAGWELFFSSRTLSSFEREKFPVAKIYNGIIEIGNVKTRLHGNSEECYEISRVPDPETGVAKIGFKRLGENELIVTKTKAPSELNKFKIHYVETSPDSGYITVEGTDKVSVKPFHCNGLEEKVRSYYLWFYFFIIFEYLSAEHSFFSKTLFLNFIFE